MEGERIIPAGQVILKEGEQGDSVYIIKSGRVSVIRETDHGCVVLAELVAGEVFGVMSLIDGSPCSATVRAEEQVRLHALKRDQFLSAMQSDMKSAQTIMQALFKRIRNMNRRVSQLEMQLNQQKPGVPGKASGQETANPSDIVEKLPSGAIALLGKTDQATHALDGLAQLVVTEFPFRIGRWSEDQEEGGGLKWLGIGGQGLDLEIHDVPPYHVSRKHCHIENKRGQLCIVDSESRSGTWVNGNKIGRRAKETKAVLRPGKHELYLGSAESAFSFDILVPE